MAIDSYFVERFVPPIGNYMQALQDAELSLHAGNIKGRNLMLIHSTADTFIHQEHALVFIKALVNQNVKFKQQVRLLVYSSSSKTKKKRTT